MRVTNAMIFGRAAASAMQARDRSQNATNQVSSGMRVVHPGDDPTSAGLAVSHRQRQVREEAILSTAGRASDELAAADGALSELGNLVSRARELAVQLSNSTYSADQRASAAQEVSALFNGAIGLLNTEVGGRYIFGGTRDATPPFDATGNYLGDSALRQVEIAPGVLQGASVRADVVAKGAGGGADLFIALGDLATALSANDLTGIHAALEPLDASIRQVAAGRSQAGASMAVFDSAGEVARAARDASKEAVAHEVEADVIESASKLAAAQQALDAALTASAHSFKLTLLDKL